MTYLHRILALAGFLLVLPFMVYWIVRALLGRDVKRCPECGEPMRDFGILRRGGLLLTSRLERLAFRVDVWTAPKFTGAGSSHFHLTDEEWASFEEAIR